MGRKRPALPGEVQKNWDEFWASIVTKNGRLDRRQLALELFDFHRLMGHARKVYDHVTGGRISDIRTLPEVVIAVATDVENESLESILADERAVWEEERTAEDTCHVSLGAPGADGYWGIRVIVPEGIFFCRWFPGSALQVNPDRPLPADWIETVVDAAEELSKQEG